MIDFLFNILIVVYLTVMFFVIIGTFFKRPGDKFVEYYNRVRTKVYNVGQK